MSRPDLYRAAIAAGHPRLIRGIAKDRNAEADLAWNVYVLRLMHPELLTAEVAELLCATVPQILSADSVLIEAGVLR